MFQQNLEACGLELAAIAAFSGNFYAVNGQALPGEKAATVRAKLGDCPHDSTPRRPGQSSGGSDGGETATAAGQVPPRR